MMRLFKVGMLCLIFLAVFISCGKNALDTGDLVKITNIIFNKSPIAVNDTVKIECVTRSAYLLHYHWQLLKGNTVYNESIIDRASWGYSFDHGQWIKWSPPSAGQWEVEVLAYRSEADHSTEGGGSRRVYYEYDEYGSIIHCFYVSDQGPLWDIKSVFVNVIE